MQRESQLKDETIKSLGDEIEAANERILGFTDHMKGLEDKLNSSQKENVLLQKRIQTENRKFEEVMAQLADLRKKYVQARGELERELKRAERVKTTNAARLSELEEENQKQKTRIRDLQGKLEAALIEIKKNQNLAVSNSRTLTATVTNTDGVSFSVPHAAAPAGAAEEDPLHVQVGGGGSAPSSPAVGERAWGDAGHSPVEIHVRLEALGKENAALKQKVVYLKGEQMRACQIIKVRPTVWGFLLF